MTSPEPISVAVITTRLISIRIWSVWALLVLASVVSAWLGDEHGPPRIATTIVIALAMGKVFLVGEHFMELRTAPVIFRLIFAAWVVVIGVALVVLYMHGGSPTHVSI